MDHEIEVEYQEVIGENKNQSPDSTQNGDSCFSSSLENNEINTAQSEVAEKEEHHELRRSMSTGHIPMVDRSEYEQYHTDETLR